MRRYRSPDGETRLWFDDTEIEHLVEDELVRARLMPTADAPVTDLDRFVEIHLGCELDPYAPLPSSILGVTAFHRHGPPRVSINRDLTGSALDEDESAPGVLGRWRATLAHEAGHVVLHRSLFLVDENQAELFAAPTVEEPELMRCLKRDVAHGKRDVDWREVQANKAMAALLMPKRTFNAVVRAELAAIGATRTNLAAGGPAAMVLAKRLSRRLQVSREAVTIRLRTTGYVTAASTRSLADD